MALNFIKHKWQKVVLATVVIITAVVLLLALLINVYFSPILADKVKSAVLKGTDSLYKIDFADAKLHILKGEIVIYDIHFRPDTAAYNKHIKNHPEPNSLTELHVKRLVISHIHPFKLYFKKVLDIGKITLSAPDIRIKYYQDRNKDTVTDKRTAWQKLSKTFKSAHVGQIILNDVMLRYEDNTGPKQTVNEFKELNVLANDLLIDSLTQTDTSRLFYCRDIVADLYNYKGTTANGLYNYAVKSVKLSTFKSQLTIVGFEWEPIKNYFDKGRKDRFKIHIDSLLLNNFDYMTYHKSHSLSASSMVLNGGTVDVFKNPNKRKEPKKDKTKSFPNKAIYSIGADVKIDTFLIRKLNVIYGEYNSKSAQNGAITFNNTHGQMLNLTTNKVALQKNNISIIQLNTRFMNRGEFKVFFTFNLTDKLASYSYKGRLGAMDLRDINPATVPFALAKITEGKLKEFTFDVKGNSKIARGRIQLLYNNLRVKLLKADTATQTLKRKTIVSLFANLFIIKDNNPDNPGEIARFANVVYYRPVDFPFFKTIWKTLLAGLKTNIGMDEKAEQATTKMVDESNIKKQTREIKKAQRKQKRAERKRTRELKRAQKEMDKKTKN